jgi:hypothetical protein
MDVARGYTYRNGKFKPRRKKYIVQVAPYFAREPERGSDSYNLFVSSELKLYKPFIEISDLSGDYDSIQLAYKAFKTAGYQRVHVLAESEKNSAFNEIPERYPNSYPTDDGNQAEKLIAIKEDKVTKQNRLEWQYLAESNVDLPRELVNSHMLGKRSFDLAHQWPCRLSLTAPVFDAMKGWLCDTVKKHPEDFRKAPIVGLDTLNDRQAAASNMVRIRYTVLAKETC